MIFAPEWSKAYLRCQADKWDITEGSWVSNQIAWLVKDPAERRQELEDEVTKRVNNYLQSLTPEERAAAMTKANAENQQVQ